MADKSVSLILHVDTCVENSYVRKIVCLGSGIYG